MNDTLIICDAKGEFIKVHAADQSPVRVPSAWRATHWRLLKEATEYRDKFPEEKWTIKVFRATALWEVGKSEAQ